MALVARGSAGGWSLGIPTMLFEATAPLLQIQLCDVVPGKAADAGPRPWSPATPMRDRDGDPGVSMASPWHLGTLWVFGGVNQKLKYWMLFLYSLLK